MNDQALKQDNYNLRQDNLFPAAEGLTNVTFSNQIWDAVSAPNILIRTRVYRCIVQGLIRESHIYG